ncbi:MULTISPECIES: hypothetical protein [Halobacteriovorax]|uniref:Uncharacterized protein n=1 Tax=Halobacteriovorax vibrionivorans TaxID=2152716 RepID=A0ABY0IJ70_9BACT|nr:MULTISPECIES: hypothetical protein [Halobacteriovorax]AYF45969.1 hypothetical protein BALOs_2987 [Halobacteriovorax sp. BALOs_7]RZF22997.1 hypothetical protein DAY19_04290 [Halobacteriovorax vibrionivorans]TGD46860.1 hypothetical protein EP118_10150 [Halobacteriovorax sp. Y22]
MKNKKILEFTLESLVYETFDILEPNESEGIKLKYISDTSSYRVEWDTKTLDFPKSFALIQDLIKGCYLDLKSYDVDLDSALKEFFNTTEDIYFYVFGDDLYLRFKEYADIKKAA